VVRDAVFDINFCAPGMVRVTVTGPPLALIGRGNLRGRIVDSSGDPVAAVDIELVSLVPGIGYDQ